MQHGGQLLESVTFSMGIAAFPTHASNAETLVKAADKALHQAKNEGRDRIIVAPPTCASPAVSETIASASVAMNLDWNIRNATFS